MKIEPQGKKENSSYWIKDTETRLDWNQLEVKVVKILRTWDAMNDDRKRRYVGTLYFFVIFAIPKCNTEETIKIKKEI